MCGDVIRFGVIAVSLARHSCQSDADRDGVGLHDAGFIQGDLTRWRGEAGRVTVYDGATVG